MLNFNLLTMSSKQNFKRIVVALNLPTAISLLIIKAKAVLKAMRESSNFTALSAKLDSLQNAVLVFETAETACNTTPPTGSTEARDIAKENVCSILRSLRGDVQDLADAD
jgi:TATA-box binding protein (TBP) (component of TFIID and TFIIIB)